MNLWCVQKFVFHWVGMLPLISDKCLNLFSIVQCWNVLFVFCFVVVVVFVAKKENSDYNFMGHCWMASHSFAKWNGKQFRRRFFGSIVLVQVIINTSAITMSVDSIVIFVVCIIENIAAASIETTVRFITYLIVPQMLYCMHVHILCGCMCVVFGLKKVCAFFCIVLCCTPRSRVKKSGWRALSKQVVRLLCLFIWLYIFVRFFFQFFFSVFFLFFQGVLMW